MRRIVREMSIRNMSSKAGMSETGVRRTGLRLCCPEYANILHSYTTHTFKRAVIPLTLQSLQHALVRFLEVRQLAFIILVPSGPDVALHLQSMLLLLLANELLSGQRKRCPDAVATRVQGFKVGWDLHRMNELTNTITQRSRECWR